jgi:hypothetical protein
LNSKLRIVLVHDKNGWEYADKIYESAENGAFSPIQHKKSIPRLKERKSSTLEHIQRYYNKQQSNESTPLLNSVIDIAEQPDGAKIPRSVYSKYFNLNEYSGLILFLVLMGCFTSFQTLIIAADTLAIYWAREESKFNSTNSTSVAHNNLYFRQISFSTYSCNVCWVCNLLK